MIISFGQRSRWFLAEFVVIIVGVLVALGIDEWRDTLQDEEREQEYLEQLAADLQVTTDMFVTAAELNAPWERAARQLAEIFERGEPADIETVRQILADAGTFDNPVPVLGTADALISTGDLRLIRDPKVRTAITRYVSRMRDYFLFPLYQLEDQHRNIYLNIVLLAQQYGIAPASRQGPAEGLRNADINGFLANAEAYVYVVRFAELKEMVRSIRNVMSDEAAALAALLPLGE
jgi:sensor c-di-GMP phosphodiesterase-like protein